MSECVFGADPGSTGAITATWKTDIRVWSVEKFSYCELATLVKAFYHPHSKVCYMEHVHGRRGDFVNKAFAFGRSTGKMEMCFELAQVEIIYVEPQEWKKMFGLLGIPPNKRKSAEQAAVNKTWPHLKITQNAAASACLALYGEMKELGV